MTDSGGDGTILAAQCSADDTLVDTLALCKQQQCCGRASCDAHPLHRLSRPPIWSGEQSTLARPPQVVGAGAHGVSSARTQRFGACRWPKAVHGVLSPDGTAISARAEQSSGPSGLARLRAPAPHSTSLCDCDYRVRRTRESRTHFYDGYRRRLDRWRLWCWKVGMTTNIGLRPLRLRAD